MDIDINIEDFIEAVEDQHNFFMEAVTGPGPLSDLLREFFPEDFIAQKDAEHKEAVREYRDSLK